MRAGGSRCEARERREGFAAPEEGVYFCDGEGRGRCLGVSSAVVQSVGGCLVRGTKGRGFGV